MSLQALKLQSRGPDRAKGLAGRADLDRPALTDMGKPNPPDARRPLPAPGAGMGRSADAGPHDAVLMVDVETVVDEDLLPAGWPVDKFPKAAWHRIVAISIVEASLELDDCDGTELYRIRSCRSGGEPAWGEERLLRSFWKMFEAGRYRMVTWNGRSFDIPALLQRSMKHGIAVPAWFQRGTKWDGYGSRYAIAWHTDLMEVMSDHGATARLTLDEGAALVGAPGKMGEHGSSVAELVAAGAIGRVRDYCETDVLNLFLIYVRWALLTGRTGPDGHDATVAGLIEYLDGERSTRPHLGRFLEAWRSIPGAPCAGFNRPDLRRNVPLLGPKFRLNLT